MAKIDTHSLQGFTRYIKDNILQSYQEIYMVVNCYIGGAKVGLFSDSMLQIIFVMLNIWS